jgi:uncharacterized caspase-like protein
MGKFLIALVAIQSLCTVAEAKTYALIVGVSEYPKMPRDLWLQYPKADAAGLAKTLAVPPDQLLLLTDGQATTAALRDAFKTFLKRPGKDDTVFIFIAGHGNVDESGAYILTSDSDPSNLAATALPMGEVQQLVEGGLSNAGHVVFLADVCRAGMIGSIKLGAVVAQIGDAPGELLGLMAARPRELSIEGPEFGGGHGAFTDSVLRGLGGAADSDHDGFVTAGELIDYVTKDVPGKTRDKQHPREFGDMDNSTKLAAISK